MKRLSLLITLSALIAFSAAAQQQSLKKFQPEKMQALQVLSRPFQLTWDRPVDEDTFGNLLAAPCDTTFYLFYLDAALPLDSCCLSGNNFFIDSAKAERYQGVPGDQIDGLWVFFATSTYTSTTQKSHLKIWDDNGAGNLPGTILGNVDRTNKSISDDINAGNLTTVYFSTPIAMPADGNFYAGVQLEYKLKQGLPAWDPNRTVGLANPFNFDVPSCNDTSTNTAYEKYSDGSWHSYVESYGLGMRNPVFPIVGTNTGCTITITPPSATICKGKKVTLKATGATTYSWSPITGLNCTTCATVSAKPTTTTTYTVTGDGGACSATVTVTVNPAPTAGISQSACTAGHITLTRTGTPTTGVKFQWIKDGTPISGATNSTFSATASGSYQVKVTITATGCNKTSKPSSVVINCKQSNEVNAFDASVYPNPFTKSMSITFASGSGENANVVLLDFSGRTIREFKNVDVNTPLEIDEDLSPGVYFVKVIQGENQKMIKVVKN